MTVIIKSLDPHSHTLECRRLKLKESFKKNRGKARGLPLWIDDKPGSVEDYHSSESFVTEAL